MSKSKSIRWVLARYFGERHSEDWDDDAQEFLPAAWIIEIDDIKSIIPAEEYVGQMYLDARDIYIKYLPATCRISE